MTDRKTPTVCKPVSVGMLADYDFTLEYAVLNLKAPQSKIENHLK